MKISRFLAATAGATLLASLVAGPVASAQTTTGTTDTTFTVTNGSLAISVPTGTQTLNEASNTLANGYRISGKLGTTKVTDQRNTTTTGWSVTADAIDFTTKDAQNAVLDTINDEAVKIEIANVLSQTLGGVAQTTLFTPTAGGTTGEAAGGKIGEVTAATLSSLLGTLLNSNNSVEYDPTITVTVPPDTKDGVYTGTITQTVL